jgi:glycosyltransferase involved in cell wall biosynthesis
MRLLVIVDTYVPARISGALQMRDLARELLAQHHEPTVIVASPDLRTPWKLERIDDVEVLRVKTPQTKDVGLIRRALAECWLPFAMLRGLRHSPLAEVRWQGVIWYSPTIFFGPMVRSIKRRFGCPGYLILRDLFPDWAVDAGVMRKGLAYRFFKRVERYQYASADVIGVQTAANVRLVEKEAGGRAQVEVLNNWLSVPDRSPTAVDLSDGPLAGRTIFVYTGNMGAAQGMDCLIDLAAALQGNDRVGFLFVGRGSDVKRLKARVAAQALVNVVFIEEVDSGEIPAILEQSHIGLIALDPRHTTHNIPGKLLSYLHAGLPVLARINPGNDLEGLINNEGIGRVVAGDEQARLLEFAAELASSPELRKEMNKRTVALAGRDFSSARVAGQIVAQLRSPRFAAPAVDRVA